jgi:CBS domain-containing protein
MNVQSWTVQQVMTDRPNLVVAWPDTPFKQIVELLQARDISAVPVVDTADHVLGVVSEADLLLPAGARTATELMTSPAVTVAAGASIGEAARVMHERRVKRLPVVDAEGRLLGIVSRRDLLSVFLRSDRDLAAEIRDDLRRLLWVGPPDVKVTVTRGVVRLQGRLETRSLAELAARLPLGVSGVVEVRNELTWERDDRDIRVDGSPLALSLSASERRGL